MENKNFLNIHVLISHSPSCLNRDDMNMQKSAIFGGVRRVRISSQSLKRAMRKSSYYLTNLGAPSIRTRSLELLKQEFIEELKNKFDASVIAEAIDRFAKTSVSSQKDDEQEEEVAEELETAEKSKTASKKIAVAPWVKDEISIICGIVGQTKKEGLSDSEIKAAEDKHAKQNSKKKKTLQEVKDEIINKKIEKAIKEKLKLTEWRWILSI